MFKTFWHKDNNLVTISDIGSNHELILPPRPVFYEELDLLGLNKYWKYNKNEYPLLWAIGRKYYYSGELVVEAIGGNIFDKPKIKIYKKNLELEPIDMDKLVEKNIKYIKIIEGEAIDFIQDTYLKYNDKVDSFSVAFSGGKDSQVVLDLVSRVLSPDKYIVSFIDTTMELPTTYDTVSLTKKYYKELYPKLKFISIKPPKNAIELWKEFGPPSRIHRWCCSVYKTIPFGKYLKSLNENKHSKILVYEGVRAEESNKRSNYKRITNNVKGTGQINAEPILNWNLFEIYLYIFYRKIVLNKGYKYGLTRVGCSVCPFSSNWSEFIANNIFPETMAPFIEYLYKIYSNDGISQEVVLNYIKNGQWKTRAGGRDIINNNIRISFLQKGSQLICTLENVDSSLTEWLKVLGDLIIKEKNGITVGQIQNEGVLNFIIEKYDNREIVRFDIANKDTITIGLLKKIIFKSSYCINCGACELLCPTGAITSSKNKIKINQNKCIHCLKCLTYFDKGCLRAKSLSISKGGKTMNNKKISTSKYQTFGLRSIWLESFLNNSNGWFQRNEIGLGNRQIESLINWLKDAEVITNTNEFTVIHEYLVKISNEDLLWSIIWINLYSNVEIISWYCDTLPWGTKLSVKELINAIIEYDPSNREKTTANIVNSLVNMFAHSPLGNKLKIGVINKESKTRYIEKIGFGKTNQIAIAYSLYKYAEINKKYNMTISEFYKDNCYGGPYKLLGVGKDTLKNAIISLQENTNKILRADLAANLDNIFLNEEYSSVDILRFFK